MTAPTFETTRLRLRGHVASDFAPFLAMWQQPQFYQYLSGQPLSAEEVWTKLLRHAGLWSLQGYGYWAVEEQATGQFIGAIGYGEWQRALEPSFVGWPEIGWVLAPHTHGRGYATEAVRAAQAWGDANLAPPRTVCLIDVANAPSRHLATKVGYHEFDRTIYKGHPVVLLERFATAVG